ncbi:hypothetical protein P5673_015198 [Acropora cervicornis]|uniref:Uncharacterized protein n=1 Tax=Acropora cervicornis TaxID=6130 RepID=A0AAD9V5C4_ACRCE|nr:hypothetical protein P5673_015198 [Acropora cervicornis]
MGRNVAAEEHKTVTRRGRTEIYRNQAIVEIFSKTLAGRLFGFQNGEEMAKTGRSIAWVKTLPEVVPGCIDQRRN